MKKTKGRGSFPLTTHPGRPKGVPNKVTLQVREFSQHLLSSSKYRANLKQRLEAGKLGPLEPILWHYAYGKPKDTIEIQDPDGALAARVVFYLPDNGRDPKTI